MDVFHFDQSNIFKHDMFTFLLKFEFLVLLSNAVISTCGR